MLNDHCRYDGYYYASYFWHYKFFIVASIFSVLFSQGRCFFSFVCLLKSRHDGSSPALTLICSHLQAAAQIAEAGSKVNLQVSLRPNGGAVALQLTLMQLEETNTQKTDLLKVTTPVAAVIA